jgi:hypothetical protein
MSAYLYDAYEDCGAPTYEEIARRSHRVRVPRRLNCGHLVDAGDRYQMTVCKVDGEFTVDHECTWCYAEREGDPDRCAVYAEAVRRRHR